MRFQLLLRIIFSLIIYLLIPISCKRLNSSYANTEPPKAIKGILDLRNNTNNGLHPFGIWNFESDGRINLDGEWEFYWNVFLEPIPVDQTDILDLHRNFTIKNPQSKLQYISVPTEWNKYEVNGKQVGSKGYATYRLKVLLQNSYDNGRKQSYVTSPSDNQDKRMSLGLKIPDIGTAYKLFTNGKLIAEVGRIDFSSCVKTHPCVPAVTPAYLPQVVSIPNNGEFIDLIIQVANFDHSKGGIWNKIILGRLEKLQKEREENLILVFFLFGALLLMGVYHLGIFSLRRKEKSTLYFSLFCLLMALRILLTGDRYWFLFFPDFPWTMLLFLDFLTIYAGVPIFTLFVYSIFQDEMPRWLLVGIITICSLLLLIIVLLPTNMYSQTLPAMHFIASIAIINCTYTMVLAIYRKRLGAKSFFVGSIVFAIIIMNDLLYSNGYIYTGLYSPFGFLFFVLSQAFFLSMRSSRAFVQAETLTNELKSLNETLEDKVQERTTDLSLAKKEMEELNKLIKSLNVDLDIKVIMQKVLKYVNNKFGIQYYALYSVDPEKTYNFLLDINFPDHVSEEDRIIIFNLQIPILNVKGAHAFTFKAKKPLYIHNMKMKGGAVEELYIAEKYQIKSMLLIPLLLNEEPIGILDFSSEGILALSKEDIIRLSILGEQLAGIINGSNLLKEIQNEKEKVEKSRYEAEIEKGIALIAQLEAEIERNKSEDLLLELNDVLKIIKSDLYYSQKIQASMLDYKFDTIQGINIHVNYSPMQEVGGDFYSIKEIKPGITRIFLADATGHGVQAALITMLIKSEYENLEESTDDCSILLTKLNSIFFQKYLFLSLYFTCVVIDIDRNTNKIIYSFAGHPRQVILNGSKLKEFGEQGKIIRLFRDAKYQKAEMNFNVGDKLILFTDGVFEELNSSGDLFGEERFYASIIKNASYKMDQLINNIMGDIDNFLQGKGKDDDITMIGIEIL